VTANKKPVSLPPPPAAGGSGALFKKPADTKLISQTDDHKAALEKSGNSWTNTHRGTNAQTDTYTGGQTDTHRQRDKHTHTLKTA